MTAYPKWPGFRCSSVAGFGCSVTAVLDREACRGLAEDAALELAALIGDDVSCGAEGAGGGLEQGPVPIFV
jgi:hypothetical protein